MLEKSVTGASEAAQPPAVGTLRYRYVRNRRGPWVQFSNLSRFEWNRLELSLPELAPELAGVRILHLSDLHLRRRWRRALDEVIARTQADPPDLIVFTGDFVDDKADHRPALPLVARFVTSLRSRHGAFGVVGNHDGDLLAPRLATWGVQVITHQRVEVKLRGEAAIELIGLPGPDRADVDEGFIAAQPPKRAGVPRIVLSHYPDLITAARPLRPDLYLAGHTHGGQMCLPGGCPILTHDRLPRHLAHGAHEVDGTLLMVTRGLGYTTLPMRLCCPAEVVEVELLSH